MIGRHEDMALKVGSSLLLSLSSSPFLSLLLSEPYGYSKQSYHEPASPARLSLSSTLGYKGHGGNVL